MIVRSLLSSLVLGVALLVSAPASAVDTLGWEDLAPPWDQTKDPFSHLTEDQQNFLYDIFWVRNLREDGRSGEELDATEAAARRHLATAGYDVDRLVTQVEEFVLYLKTQENTLVEELDGKDVKIPGYALPLEFSGETITEFLLVPYVGACIHTPPPPANQIVHVKSDEGFENMGLYTPVWVTGQISAAPSKQALTFVDGTSDISVGYGLAATRIEPYED